MSTTIMNFTLTAIVDILIFKLTIRYNYHLEKLNFNFNYSIIRYNYSINIYDYDLNYIGDTTVNLTSTLIMVILDNY